MVCTLSRNNVFRKAIEPVFDDAERFKMGKILNFEC